MSDRRSVKEEEAADFAARNKLMYVEMSALLDDSNVETAFRTLVQCKTYVSSEIINKPGQWAGKSKPEPKLLKEAVLSSSTASTSVNGSPPSKKVHLSSKSDSAKKNPSNSNCCA